MRIAGRVISKNGSPVAGAKVEIFANEDCIAGLNTAGDGRFEFSTNSAYEARRLKVVDTKTGFETLQQEIDLRENGDLLLRLVPIIPPLPWWRRLISSTLLRWGVPLIVAAACVVGFALWSQCVRTRVQVPDLTSNSLKDASNRLNQLGLKPSPRPAPGGSPFDTVISQDPNPNQPVEPGSTVTLTYHRSMQVPDLMNKSLRDASDILGRLGLKASPTAALRLTRLSTKIRSQISLSSPEVP